MTRGAQITVPKALLEKAKFYAAQHKLDAALVCAIVEQETEGTWDPHCVRFEPGFLKRYLAPLVAQGKLDHDQLTSLPTEETTRAMSWGLMQVMGEVARELGFKGWLTRLCDPDVGLDYGCSHLVRKIASAEGDVREGLRRWNGGGNPSYADEVLARMARYQASGQEAKS